MPIIQQQLRKNTHDVDGATNDKDFHWREKCRAIAVKSKRSCDMAARVEAACRQFETEVRRGVFCATALPFFFSNAATIFRTQLCLQRGARTFTISSSEHHCKMSMSTYRTPQLFTPERVGL